MLSIYSSTRHYFGGGDTHASVPPDPRPARAHTSCLHLHPYPRRPRRTRAPRPSRQPRSVHGHAPGLAPALAPHRGSCRATSPWVAPQNGRTCARDARVVALAASPLLSLRLTPTLPPTRPPVAAASVPTAFAPPVCCLAAAPSTIRPSQGPASCTRCVAVACHHSPLITDYALLPGHHVGRLAANRFAGPPAT